MTKTNLVYAMMGVIAGIIIGVIIGNASLVPQQVVTASTQNGTTQQQLPEGHPPVDQTELLTELARYQAILMKDPENQQSLVSAANLSYDLKNYPQAIAYYEKALIRDPKNINLITDLGTSYFYSNHPQRALELYNRSLSIDSKHQQSLMNTGVVKMNIGDPLGAADAWEALLSYHPDFPDADRMRDTVKQLRAAK